ncbi:TetR/AcrR family transcriptional regulator [Gordonia sp. DT101]|uniref:TetR/AcrR family transcriptional regulator n=1 Tax=Gordonia sp. DT101 TaxID=3416545 RepID=UPI003CE688DC
MAGPQVLRPPMRELLIRAGVELLEERGIDAVGVRAVSRRAGVSHGAPRRYFPSHRSLLAAIARTGIIDFVGVVRPILADATTPPRTRLIDSGEAYLDFAHRRPAMFDLMTRHDLLDRAGADLRSLTLPLMADLHAVVMEGTAGDTDDRLRTLALWASIHGIAVLASNQAFALYPGIPTPDDTSGSGAATARALLARAVDAHLA